MIAALVIMLADNTAQPYNTSHVPGIMALSPSARITTVNTAPPTVTDTVTIQICARGPGRA